MDLARGLGSLGSLGDGPGPHLRLTRCQVGDQAQLIVALPNQAIQTRFLKAQLGKEHGFVLGGHFGDLAFQPGAHRQHFAVFGGGILLHRLEQRIAPIVPGDVAFVHIGGINHRFIGQKIAALDDLPLFFVAFKGAGGVALFQVLTQPGEHFHLVGELLVPLQGLLGLVDLTYASLIIFCLATWGMTFVLPSGFIPNEDQGMIYVNVDAPPGATLERSEAALSKVQAALLPLEEVETVSTLAGYSLMTETEGASFGMGMINLKPWNEREQTAEELMRVYADRVSHIKDADIQFFLPPTVPGFGNASGFELRLQDKTAGTFAELDEVAKSFVAKLNADPRLSGVTSGFNPNFPQYLLRVDLAKAAKLGIDVNESMETLQSYVGSFYSSNFVRFGQMYKVMLQAAPEYRMNPEDLFGLYAKNKEGNMVPYSNFMTMERVYGPSQITRYNLFTSAMITGEQAPGVSSGEALEAVEEIAAEVLPRGYDIEWSGVAREEKESGGQSLVIFAICLVFVYLLLAAQYESLLLPLPVILSLPAGVFGSFLLLYVVGLENNIYAQVALVMLIGLLGKNAILIIEVANQCRKEGVSIMGAAIQGATSRLRPILMTSFAFISGLIPLAVASGAGALGNRSIGTAAAGGMLIGTFVGIFLIPGLYVIFESLATYLKEKKQKANEEEYEF